MAIIFIGRGAFSRGADVAEKVAQHLDHVCLGREAVVEAAAQYNVPEIKLTHALEDAPSVLDRIAGGRKRYVAYVRAMLLKHFQRGNVVYHGIAAAHLLTEVPNSLKVRLVADVDDRVDTVMHRDGVDRQEARRIIAKADESRRRWGLQVHGIDLADPLLYDTVVHVGRMGVDGAVGLICHLAKQDPFRTSVESLAVLEDMALVASAEAMIADMDVDPTDLRVTVVDGTIRIGIKTTKRIREGTSSRARAYFVRDLRDHLQEQAKRLEAKAIVELIDSE